MTRRADVDALRVIAEMAEDYARDYPQDGFMRSVAEEAAAAADEIEEARRPRHLASGRSLLRRMKRV